VRYFLAVIMLLASQSAFAQAEERLNLQCAPLKGIRADFNNGYLASSEDGMSKSSPTLQYDFKSKSGELTLQDSMGIVDKVKVALLTVGGGEYFGFVTVINGAPTLLNYYHNINLLMYTQTAFSPRTGIPVAKVFISKCKIVDTLPPSRE
jgi:hypothetical protein